MKRLEVRWDATFCLREPFLALAPKDLSAEVVRVVGRKMEM